MTFGPRDVQALLDHEQIRAGIAGVARGEDRRDAELIRASFWPGATTDFGIFAGDFDATEHDVVLGGRYLDRLEGRDGEWRIAQRTMLYDWSRDLGVAADWSQGLMGEPFRGDHHTGKANGDHSEAFFDSSRVAGQR